jgi:hypothetical protein
VLSTTTREGKVPAPMLDTAPGVRGICDNLKMSGDFRGHAWNPATRLGWRPRTGSTDLVQTAVETDLPEAGLDTSRHRNPAAEMGA